MTRLHPASPPPVSLGSNFVSLNGPPVPDGLLGPRFTP